MKDKIICCLLSLLIILNISKPCLVSADALALDPSQIAALGDLGLALLGGANFDFTGTVYTIPDSLANNAQELATEKAYEFLEDYHEKRFQPGMLTSIEFYNSLYETNTNYSLSTTDQEKEDALIFRVSPSIFASWTSFDAGWYHKYINSLVEAGEVSPSIPEEFQYLENTTNFIWNGTQDLTIGSNKMMCYQYNPGIGTYNPDICSFFSILGNSDFSSVSPSSIGTINIIDNGSSVTLQYVDFNPVQWLGGTAWQIYGYGSNEYYLNVSSVSGYQSSVPAKRTDFPSLTIAANYIFQNFRHVNINYNGVSWVDVSDQAPANPLIPDFPDIINPDDELPAYNFDLPDTSTGEGYFDLTSILSRLTQAILDASDNDDSTDAELDKDDVIVLDLDKEIVTPKEKTYADLYEDEVNINKNLPVVPLPPNIVDAFQGTSILAELIDGTQTVLPDELMTTFWGIVSTIFIIGLIRVMHK